jgi:CheY-like chemotaxis protein/HPt (histidine-containing phosphotransfer) domain-containing protein
MNSILGIAQILLTENRLSESHKKYITDIKTSANTLLNTINDIIDLSRLSTGRMSLTLRDYNFIQFVDYISAFAKSAAKEKGLDYNFKTADKLPQCLYGDDARLKQLLQALICYTFKFTEKGSVTLNITVAQNNLVFEISNTGAGSVPEFSAQNVGDGFKLPIAKSLCDLMDGEITFTNENNAGSVCTVSIPIIKGDKSKLKAKTVKSDLYFSRDARVLIVDDNEVHLHIAKGLILSLYGINCDTALSGIEALSFIEKHSYDLIFMDFIMPEPDGIESTALIREAGKKNASVPIIALTANVVEETKDMFMKAGMNDFLAKPIITDELNTILQRWLPAEKRIQKPENPHEVDDLLSFMEKGGRIITAAMSISELDVNAGLSNVAFKEDVYENSLKLPLGNIPKVITQLQDCLTKNNLPGFTAHVSEIGSSLTAVGATSLAEMAKALEDAAKENDTESCEKNLPAFTSRLQSFREQLAAIFPSLQSSGKKVGTREVLDDCLSALTEAIEKYNYDLLVRTVARLTTATPRS